MVTLPKPEKSAPNIMFSSARRQWKSVESRVCFLQRAGSGNLLRVETCAWKFNRPPVGKGTPTKSDSRSDAIKSIYASFENYERNSQSPLFIGPGAGRELFYPSKSGLCEIYPI